MALIEFWPFESRDERWWQACYLQSSLLDPIIGQTQWTVITGPPGCGKSVLLQALQQGNQPVLKVRPTGLTTRLIQLSGYFPNCLLQAISTLIDVHVEHNPDTVLLNKQDWQAMQRRLG